MVARLKLKEIDGKAPPGVNIAITASRSSSAPESSPKGLVVHLWHPAELNASPPRRATPPNCGDPLKLQIPSRCSKDSGGQVNCLGYGHNAEDVTMGNPHPSPSGASHCGKVQRLDGGGWFVFYLDLFWN